MPCMLHRNKSIDPIAMCFSKLTLLAELTYAEPVLSCQAVNHNFGNINIHWFLNLRPGKLQRCCRLDRHGDSHSKSGWELDWLLAISVGTQSYQSYQSWFLQCFPEGEWPWRVWSFINPLCCTENCWEWLVAEEQPLNRPAGRKEVFLVPLRRIDGSTAHISSRTIAGPGRDLVMPRYGFHMTLS